MTTATVEKKAGDTLSESARVDAALTMLAERGQREGVERSILRSLSDPVRDALADYERDTIDHLPPEVSSEIRTNLQLKHALLLQEGFKGNIRGLMNDKYSRANLELRLHEIIGMFRDGDGHGEGKDEAIEHTKRSAFLQFDLDGLKAVNDLGSMALGNKYLEKFGEAMSDVKKKLTDEGAHVTLTRDGGDEFGFFVSFSDRYCTQKEINSIIGAVQEAFAKKSAGILNVQDPTIRAKIEAKGLEVSRETTFHGTVSGGGISVYEALVEGHDYVESVDSYQRSLEVMAGDVMRETAIDRAKKQKTLERLRWAKGSDQEKFHAALLNIFRGIPAEAVRHFEHEVAEKDRIIAERDRKIEEQERKINEQALFNAQLQAKIAELQAQQVSYGEKKRAAG